MRFAAGLFAFVLKFGGLGLLVLGILDSSFLFAPWGNDLLVVAMTARHPHYGHMLYYAAMSTVPQGGPNGPVSAITFFQMPPQPLTAPTLVVGPKVVTTGTPGVQ